jgi:hypothetical protein
MEKQGQLIVGNGARFWSYLSTEYNTPQFVTEWNIQIQQENGNWTDVISSADPGYEPQTPGLSGIFKLRVTASGPNFGTIALSPTSWSKPDIGCHANCAAMIGIVAAPDGKSAQYWTTSDAYCSRN